MESKLSSHEFFVFTTMRRVFVCFLVEIQDTNKTFRNYLTFKQHVLLFTTLFILTAFNFNYTTLVFYILARLMSRSPTSSSFTWKGSYKGNKMEDFYIPYSSHFSLQLSSELEWRFWFVLWLVWNTTHIQSCAKKYGKLFCMEWNDPKSHNFFIMETWPNSEEI